MGLAVLENQLVFLCNHGTALACSLCSQDTFTCSRSTYYGSPDCYGTPTHEMLYRNGTGCGACYHVRCTTPQYCSEDGVNVVVTDYGEGDKTDFILSPRAYARLARPNVALELFARGVIDVEYRRVSCHYSAIVVIYAAGMNDITAVELWQEDCKQWRGMRKAFGAVWDMANPPSGSIKLRFQVSGSSWVQSKNDLPALWNAGVAYDSAIQI
ncbi:hypothetical protein I3843_Q043300 [Carya illinoinensis]|nr:hypothetical protein I3843_Q043300 [Carya illinoinensis]